VAIAQDRIAEKGYIASIGVPVAPYAEIRSEADIAAASASLYPGILKAARLGYDGKGQARVESAEQARAAFASFGNVPCVLEARLPLEFEISVVVARGFDGEVVTYPVSENVHRDGILAISTAPSPRASEDIVRRARAAALQVAAGLEYCGVLCVEFFVLPGERLIVNEIAPRPHNSGHYSIDACVTSQFEQQARVLAGAGVVRSVGRLGHAQHPGRHLVPDGRTGRRAGLEPRLAGAYRQAPPVWQGRSAAWPQDGPRDLPGHRPGAGRAQCRAGGGGAGHRLSVAA